MKISKLILALWLAASAWAQAPPPKPQAEPHAAAKPSGALVVSPLPKASAPAAGVKSANSAAPGNAKSKPSGISATSTAKRHGKRMVSAERLTAHTPSDASRKPAHKGDRDPFVSPIVERGRIVSDCSGGGRKCLFVGDIVLQGVVQDSSGYIAVVASGDHTYFLHDSDPLADGDVEKITKESITLRQHSSDILGRPVVHEVTRKLGVPAG